MIKNMEMVNLLGPTEENTKDNGKMENNMEKVLILVLMVKKDKENGMKERE